MKKAVCLLALTCTLASCSPRGDGSYKRSSLGQLTGAVVGGVVGSQFGKGSGQNWATFGGAVYGKEMGRDWGNAVDRYQLQGKTRNSDGVFEHLPDETYKAWINPNTGQKTEIKPLTTTTNPNTNQPCRLFETTRAGTYSAIGMVCRDEYGRWRLMPN